MRLPPLPAAEVARRLPLWVALADLFLDTDTIASVLWIARTIVDGGFDLDEAEDWLRWEVRVAFAANLTQVAGEWAGWDEDLVRRRVLRARRARFGRWVLGRDRLMPAREWAAVRAEVARLRAAQAGASSAASVSSIQPPPSTRSPA